MSISQVAKLAGVSNATVSRVINAHPRVAPDTVRSVREAMKKLGYVPSPRRPGPKPLSTRWRLGGEGKNLAFLVIGTSRGRATPGFEQLLSGVSNGVSRNGLSLVFHHVGGDDDLPAGLLEQQRIDGLLLHGAAPGARLVDRLRNTPTVWLMRNRSRPQWGDQVAPDGLEIGHLAADYLIDRGHRLLAFLNLDAAHGALRMYEHAFVAAADEREVGVTHLVQPREPEPASGYWHEPDGRDVAALVERYRALDPRPTGLFVAEDMQVAMLQPALQAAGIELGPGKVEIISCNREEPYLFGLSPRPATIDLRLESIGRRGVEQLLWRVEHPQVPERIVTTIEPFIVAVSRDGDGASPAAAAGRDKESRPRHGIGGGFRGEREHV